jgi:hypothetical protein
MNLNEIAKTGANLTLAIGLNDLREWQKETIETTKRELENVIAFEMAETYLSPKQVSQMLNVNLTTLWRWKKRGYLAPIEVGGLRRYRMSDVKSLMNGRRGK